MKVKIYSTSTCPWCKIAKDWFRKNKIAFEEINVEENKAASAEVMRKGGVVPLIEIDGTTIIGFDEAKIKAALKMD